MLVTTKFMNPCQQSSLKQKLNTAPHPAETVRGGSVLKHAQDGNANEAPELRVWTRHEVCLVSLPPWVSLSLPYSQIFETVLIEKGQIWTGDFIFYEKGKGKQGIYGIYFPVSLRLNPSGFARLILTRSLLQAVNHVAYRQPSIATGSLFMALMENIQKKPCLCTEHVNTSVHCCR